MEKTPEQQIQDIVRRIENNYQQIAEGFKSSKELGMFFGKTAKARRLTAEILDFYRQLEQLEK